MFLQERKSIDNEISRLQRVRGMYAEVDRTLGEYGLEGRQCDATHYENAHFDYDFSPLYINQVVQGYDEHAMGCYMVDGEQVMKKILYRG